MACLRDRGVVGCDWASHSNRGRHSLSGRCLGKQCCDAGSRGAALPRRGSARGQQTVAMQRCRAATRTHEPQRPGARRASGRLPPRPAPPPRRRRERAGLGAQPAPAAAAWAPPPPARRRPAGRRATRPRPPHSPGGQAIRPTVPLLVRRVGPPIAHTCRVFKNYFLPNVVRERERAREGEGVLGCAAKGVLAAHVCVCAAWLRAPHRRRGRRAARRAAAGGGVAPRRTRPPACDVRAPRAHMVSGAPLGARQQRVWNLDGAAELPARNVGIAPRQRRLGRARVLLPGARRAPGRHLCGGSAAALHELSWSRKRSRESLFVVHEQRARRTRGGKARRGGGRARWRSTTPI